MLACLTESGCSAWFPGNTPGMSVAKIQSESILATYADITLTPRETVHPNIANEKQNDCLRAR